MCCSAMCAYIACMRAGMDVIHVSVIRACVYPCLHACLSCARACVCVCIFVYVHVRVFVRACMYFVCMCW